MEELATLLTNIFILNEIKEEEVSGKESAKKYLWQGENKCFGTNAVSQYIK